MNMTYVYIAIAVIITIAIISGVIYGNIKHKREQGDFETDFPLAPHVKVGQVVEVTIDGKKGPAQIVKKFKGTNRIRVRKL